MANTYKFRHLDDYEINAFIDDILEGEPNRRVLAHLMVCSGCAGRVEALRAVDATFPEAAWAESRGRRIVEFREQFEARSRVEVLIGEFKPRRSTGDVRSFGRPVRGRALEGSVDWNFTPCASGGTLAFRSRSLEAGSALRIQAAGWSREVTLQPGPEPGQVFAELHIDAGEWAAMPEGASLEIGPVAPGASSGPGSRPGS
jgi:Putative zinc-finger